MIQSALFNKSLNKGINTVLLRRNPPHMSGSEEIDLLVCGWVRMYPLISSWCRSEKRRVKWATAAVK